MVKSDPGRSAMWTNLVKANGRQNFTPSATSVLCKNHFAADQFVPDAKRPTLILGAVPTIFGVIQGNSVHSAQEKTVNCEASLSVRA